MSRVSDAGWHAATASAGARPALALPAGALVDLPGRGKTFVVDTGTTATARGGAQTPTLILLHALACTGLLTWRPTVGALRTRYRVVIFDQRWHGQGIRSPHFRLEDCADDVAAVADALGIAQFVPVGYSMGSLVAQLTWRRHRARVAGAVMCASTTRFRDTALAPAALRVISTRVAATAARSPTIVRRTRSGHLVDSGDSQWAYGQFRSTSGTGIARAAAAISRFDSSAWIGGMDVPAAVVVTARDRLIPPTQQRGLARCIPGAAVYEVDAGHATCVLGAERFTPALQAACASVTARIGPGRPGN
jgi:pimeloyl-ACP methyl ester carboxylesterase